MRQRYLPIWRRTAHVLPTTRFAAPLTLRRQWPLRATHGGAATRPHAVPARVAFTTVRGGVRTRLQGRHVSRMSHARNPISFPGTPETPFLDLVVAIRRCD